MKAWFLLAPGVLEQREVPDPEPGANEALVRVGAVGICGSDVECYAGKHPLPNYPRLPGHEFAGTVDRAGPGWTGPPEGTRVAVDPARHCNRCYACRVGRPNCCVEVSIAGVHRPGALAEYALCRADQLFPLPDHLDFAAGAMVETLSIGAQATARAEVQEGDLTVILGAGSIGLCCLLMAQLRGARVLVSEPLPWRRVLARQLGAEVVLHPDKQSLAEAVAEFTDGYGAHVVIDATGEVEGAQAALALPGSAGRVVLLTLADQPIQLRPWQLVRQELTVLGSRLTRTDFGELVGLVASGQAPVGRLVTHRFGFDQVPDAFEAALRREELLVKAVVEPGREE